MYGDATGKNADGLLTHHDLTAGCGKDGHETDVRLLAAHSVPWNPDAVGSTEVRLAVVLRELVGCESKFALRLSGFVQIGGIVIAIDHQLSFDRNSLILVIVEVDSPAETPSRWLLGLRNDICRPDGNHLRWRLILACLDAGFWPPRKLFLPVIVQRRTTGGQSNRRK